MIKILFSAPLFFLLLVSISFAQNVKPSATPTPAEKNEDIVKISTTLIQVDVTVTNKDGKIVTDLKPEEFEVYENGQKQDVTNFSFINSETNEKLPIPTKTPEKSSISIPIPPMPVKPEQVKRTIALVVDDLGLSAEDTNFVKKSLKKFVGEQMQEGDLVAIIRTGSGIGALQQFTSNKDQLYAAIDKIRWVPNGRSGLIAVAPIEPDLSALTTVNGSKPTKSTGEIDPDVEAANLRNGVLINGTLSSLNFIVEGMKELPGRKSLMLFSDGFRLTNDGLVGKETDIRVWSPLQKLIDSATRASVVIYSMDTRGLEPLGFTAADNTAGRSQREIQQQLQTRKDNFNDDQEGLTFLAKETGGQAFLNGNDFNKGLEKMLNDQKGYYLLGYQPDSETFDAKTRRYNKLVVKVKRPGVNVRYRSGFFGVTDNVVTSAKQTPSQQILAALTSPFSANDINLRLNTLFGTDEKNGSFVHSFLHINAKDLKFTDEPDGTHKATFDVLAVSFGDNGNPVDQIQKNYTLTATNKVYQQFINDGFVYEFLFPVKKSGAYQMRVAIRDSLTAKVGSANQFIEVPDVKKNKLTLSGIVLENLTTQQWQNMLQTNTASYKSETNPMTDTSLRRFKQGTVLRYGVEIYNAKPDQTQKPQLQTQIRIFRDGKLFLDGKPKPFEPQGQTNLQRINYVGALELGKGLPIGEYVLQLVVIDNQAKEKNKLASQWVQFEIID